MKKFHLNLEPETEIIIENKFGSKASSPSLNK